MAGGVTLQVRQIGSYAAAGSAGPGDLLLMQPGGLGNPYASIDAATLVATALTDGALGVGRYVPGNAEPGTIFSGTLSTTQFGGIYWNSYTAQSPTGAVFWQGGLASSFNYDNALGFIWANYGSGVAGAPLPPVGPQMTLDNSGALSLRYGTLTVARDPGSALEVATMGYVGNNTVASFNGRKGVVQLTSGDVYGALCLDSSIATENWVAAAIQAGNQYLLANHPFVFGWNGRTGAVYLTLADITCVFFQPGQQPVTQTPPLTSNDYSIPNTAWVVQYIQTEIAGGGSTLATQQWVLANTVNSFNGRQGVVTLTSADVYDVGAAPLNSPAFSGIPTAPTAAVGQATGQIATTAFVQQAISNNTAGVSTFNTRSGDVVLEAADVVGVGGLVNPSVGLTGNPTCPTQPPGTNLPVIANCEFVMAAIAAGTVTSFNSRTGAVTLTLADITGVGGAPLVSPAFSSVPTAPTAAPGTATVQLATCAFVANALATAGGVSSFNSRTGAVDLIANDISAAGGLVNPSVGLTGSPTATTATAGDNSQRIATTAFVQTALSSGAVSSFNTRTGAVTLQGADITAAGGALLASPAFTGAPTAPTAAPATNNTQIATTAYVTAAILADTTGVTSFNTRTGAVVLTTADITGAGGAPLASPSFTGVPLGPTATAGTSTTQLATTAFVQAAIASSGVSSFNARTGAVTLIANDISAAGGALLAGPTFTGVPAAPTAAPGTSTTQLATTAFVAASLGSYLPLIGGTVTGGIAITVASGVALSVTSSAANAINLPNGGLAALGPVSAAGGMTAGANGITYTNPPSGNLVTPGQASVTFGWDTAITTNGNLSFNASGQIGWIVRTYGVSGANNPVSNLAANANDTSIIAGTYGSQNTSWSATPSDPRLKHNVVPAGDALAIVAALKIEECDFWRPGREEYAEHWLFTLMADEVEKVLPFAYMPPPNEHGYASLHPLHLIATLWRAVQQLSARLEALEVPAE